MADNGGGNSFLGVMVGAALVLVLGIGAYVVLGHHGQQANPSIKITAPAAPAK